MGTENAYSPEAVGRRIRIIREMAEMSQSRFAGEIGVVPSTVGNWEQGRSRPSEAQIDSICRRFGVTSDYIIYGKTFGLMHGVASNLDLAERRILNN